MNCTDKIRTPSMFHLISFSSVAFYFSQFYYIHNLILWCVNESSMEGVENVLFRKILRSLFVFCVDPLLPKNIDIHIVRFLAFHFISISFRCYWSSMKSSMFFGFSFKNYAFTSFRSLLEITFSWCIFQFIIFS